MSLRPLHPSRLRSNVRKPRDMQAIKLPTEVRQAIDGIALDIFTDMTNAGCSLQETLAAIYLSGTEHAMRARGQA